MGARRTPQWDTLSTIFQTFVSMVASTLQVRRAPDWWKDWKVDWYKKKFEQEPRRNTNQE